MLDTLLVRTRDDLVCYSPYQRLASAPDGERVLVGFLDNSGGHFAQWSAATDAFVESSRGMFIDELSLARSAASDSFEVLDQIEDSAQELDHFTAAHAGIIEAAREGGKGLGRTPGVRSSTLALNHVVQDGARVQSAVGAWSERERYAGSRGPSARKGWPRGSVSNTSPEEGAPLRGVAREVRAAGGALGHEWLNNDPSSLAPLLPARWELRLQEAFRGEVLVLRALHRSDLLKSKLFALCDRGLDLADCLAMAPTLAELAEATAWLEPQDLNPLWPAHVRATLDDLVRRLGHVA